jgi:hypothetical protein
MKELGYGEGYEKIYGEGLAAGKVERQEIFLIYLK